MKTTSQETKTESSQPQQDGNANTQDNNLAYFENTEIEGTPFRMITKEEGSFAMLREYVITPTFKTKLDVKKHMSKKPIELIMALMHAMIEINKSETQRLKELAEETKS